jgi:8-oxo-dGTP pyrophosphatase MutT (NUDIX family)
MGELTRVALGLLEKDSGFVVHRRPLRIGRIAYPEKIGFLGGRVKTGKTGRLALPREIAEETGFDVPGYIQEQRLWAGRYPGIDEHGNPTEWDMELFSVPLPEDAALLVTADEGGETLTIPRGSALQGRQNEFTPFTYEALSTYVQFGKVIIGGTSGS